MRLGCVFETVTRHFASAAAVSPCGLVLVLVLHPPCQILYGGCMPAADLAPVPVEQGGSPNKPVWSLFALFGSAAEATPVCFS